MRRANSQPDSISYLQNLRTVEFPPENPTSIDEEDHGDGYLFELYDAFESLGLVGRLPAMQSFFLDGMEIEEGLGRPPPASADYSRISIKHSSVEIDAWRIIIASAKRLEEVVYTIGGRIPLNGSFIVYPHAIFNSLLSHRDSLERLDLNLEDSLDPDLLFDQKRGLETGMSDESEDHDALLAYLKGASFKDFTKLKHLSIDVYQFYYFARGIGNENNERDISLADGLPQSLESLRIYGYEEGVPYKPHLQPDLKIPDLDPHIANFMEEKDSKLPRLKQIEGLDKCIPDCKIFW
ncbi:hypothetical protein BDV12DRAFT_196645 [Aspergillus spectabilis]